MILPLKYGIGWIRICLAVQSTRDEANSKANYYDIELDIMGCDIDGCMVEIAKPMLVRAGLERCY